MIGVVFMENWPEKNNFEGFEGTCTDELYYSFTITTFRETSNIFGWYSFTKKLFNTYKKSFKTLKHVLRAARIKKMF